MGMWPVARPQQPQDSMTARSELAAGRSVFTDSWQCAYGHKAKLPAAPTTAQRFSSTSV